MCGVCDVRQGQEVEISSPSTSCLYCSSICIGHDHVLADMWPLANHGDKAETQGREELGHMLVCHLSLTRLG